MKIGRNFIIAGAIYLIAGIAFGMHMSSSGNHTLSPVHAHINLLGFTLMTVFGILYTVFPASAETTLAKVHFWCHQVGTFILVVGIYLLLSETVAEPTLVPALITSEILILVGVLGYSWNVYKTLR